MASPEPPSSAVSTRAFTHALFRLSCVVLTPVYLSYPAVGAWLKRYTMVWLSISAPSGLCRIEPELPTTAQVSSFLLEDEDRVLIDPGGKNAKRDSSSAGSLSNIPRASS